MKIEWRHEKAIANEKKHGISFEEALTVFYDPLVATFGDPDQSRGGAALHHHGLFGSWAPSGGVPY
jgi:uncharacterized DUF497 family protein